MAAFTLLAQNWRELSPGERYETLKNYQQHERLPEDGRRDVEKRYERWQQMSPDERDHIRQNYERFQQLPPQERARIQREVREVATPDGAVSLTQSASAMVWRSC